MDFGWSPLRVFREGRRKYVAALRLELFDVEADAAASHDATDRDKAYAYIRERQRAGEMATGLHACSGEAANLQRAERANLRPARRSGGRWKRLERIVTLQAPRRLD